VQSAFCGRCRGAACYFQARCGLFALVFVEIDPTLHPAHCFLIEPAGNDVASAQIFFHVKMQDLVEDFVRRQEILVFLIRFQLRARWFLDCRCWNNFLLSVYPARSS